MAKSLSAKLQTALQVIAIKLARVDMDPVGILHPAFDYTFTPGRLVVPGCQVNQSSSKQVLQPQFLQRWHAAESTEYRVPGADCQVNVPKLEHAQAFVVIKELQ